MLNMTDHDDTSLSFTSYLLFLLKLTASSSLALSSLACILIFIIGETSMDFEIGLEIDVFDGLWVLMGLPVITVLVLIVVSPISFVIYRLLFSRGAKARAQFVSGQSSKD